MSFHNQLWTRILLWQYGWGDNTGTVLTPRITFGEKNDNLQLTSASRHFRCFGLNCGPKKGTSRSWAFLSPFSELILTVFGLGSKIGHLLILSIRQSGLGSRRWNWKFQEKHFWNPNPELLFHSNHSFWPCEKYKKRFHIFSWWRTC